MSSGRKVVKKLEARMEMWPFVAGQHALVGVQDFGLNLNLTSRLGLIVLAAIYVLSLYAWTYHLPALAANMLGRYNEKANFDTSNVLEADCVASLVFAFSSLCVTCCTAAYLLRPCGNSWAALAVGLESHCAMGIVGKWITAAVFVASIVAPFLMCKECSKSPLAQFPSPTSAKGKVDSAMTSSASNSKSKCLDSEASVAHLTMPAS